METSTPIARFDADLIRRYDVNGPRYTSYPTARQFHGGVGETEYQHAVRHSNDDPIPRALSLYIHIPFCTSPCFYCGCNRIITRDHARAEAYLERLRREAALQARLFDRDRPVRQLHFGGGTPTFLEDAQLEDLLDDLGRLFAFSREPDREFGIEVDPRTATAERIRRLAQMGFTRVSFGIQDFDPEVQAAVNRVQDKTHCLELIHESHRAGFRSVSVDLIYGLPRQTLDGFRQTLDDVIQAAPERLAIYGYAHLPRQFKAQRQIRETELPSAEQRLQLLGLAVETLTSAGYQYIGMDHFARAGDDLVHARETGTLQRNFQGYSTHAGLDLVGLGLSAIGHVGRVYIQNAKTLNDYYAALDDGRLPVTAGLVATDDDLLRADIINRLMCYGEVPFREIERAHHVNFREYFPEELKRLRQLEADGLVEVGLTQVRVPPPGRFLLRNLAMVFDAYLPAVPSSQPLFSRVL